MPHATRGRKHNSEVSLVLWLGHSQHSGHGLSRKTGSAEDVGHNGFCEGDTDCTPIHCGMVRWTTGTTETTEGGLSRTWRGAKRRSREDEPHRRRGRYDADIADMERPRAIHPT